jgi:hypothetical protein
MRSRIWKCSSDQLRPANEAETLGAELMTEKGLEQILKDTKGQRATAIDVASEGPPPPEAIDEASVPAQPAPIRLDQQQQILHDLNFGLTESYVPELRKALEQRFTFGKWEENEADFAGRHVKVEQDRVTMHQEKYILEKIQTIKLLKGKLSDKTQRLEQEDFELYRSLLYKVNWVAHQTRPEMSGIVSILASRLHQATIHDMCCLNKAATYLRATARQCLTLHKFDSSKMILVAASDVGGIDGKPLENEDTVQGAWIILATGSMPTASHKVKASVLSWRSAKLRRRVASTLGGEALSFSQALGELEWLQIMHRDVVFGDVSRNNWQESLLPFLAVLKENCELRDRLDQCSVTDAKSLYDSLRKQSPASRQDRRTSIEIAIIIEALSKAKSCIRWSPHPRMIADALTKDELSKGNGALEELLRSSKFALWDEDDELARRKQNPSAKGRSKKAATALRNEAMSLLCHIHVNENSGELLNRTTHDQAVQLYDQVQSKHHTPLT